MSVTAGECMHFIGTDSQSGFSAVLYTKKTSMRNHRIIKRRTRPVVLLWIFWHLLLSGSLFSQNQAEVRKDESIVKYPIYPTQLPPPPPPPRATLHTETHMYTHAQFPVVHTHSIKEGAVSMEVAAEVPQCSTPRSPRGVDKLSQRSSLFYTTPDPHPPPFKKYALLTPASCKPQQTFFFLFLKPLSDFIS